MESDTQGYGNIVSMIGPCEEGQLLAWRLKIQADDYHVVGFLDDNPFKHGMNIHGANVLGTREDVEALASKHPVETMIVAISKIDGKDIPEILGLCEKTTAKIKIAPDLFSFM